MLLASILKESWHEILQQWKNTVWPFLFCCFIFFLRKKIKIKHQSEYGKTNFCKINNKWYIYLCNECSIVFILSWMKFKWGSQQ